VKPPAVDLQIEHINITRSPSGPFIISAPTNTDSEQPAESNKHVENEPQISKTKLCRTDKQYTITSDDVTTPDPDVITTPTVHDVTADDITPTASSTDHTHLPLQGDVTRHDDVTTPAVAAASKSEMDDLVRERDSLYKALQSLQEELMESERERESLRDKLRTLERS